MRKHLLALLITLLFSASTAWAGDIEDADAAYEKGNYAEALRKFKIAAAQGNENAQFAIGYMYNTGQGVVQNYEEAVRWYRMAAAKGDTVAQYNLGVKYTTGQGVVQNYAEAARWFRLATAKGFPAAQFNLGVMYGNGQGVIQDYVRAHMWLNIAAIKGYKDAAKSRDSTAAKMTSQQIAEAQKLARECLQRNFKACD